MRLDPILKAQLLAAAAEAGRSLAGEVEYRLALTFPGSVDERLAEIDREEVRLLQKLRTTREARSALQNAISLRDNSERELERRLRDEKVSYDMNAAKSAQEMLAVFAAVPQPFKFSDYFPFDDETIVSWGRLQRLGYVLQDRTINGIARYRLTSKGVQAAKTPEAQS